MSDGRIRQKKGKKREEMALCAVVVGRPDLSCGVANCNRPSLPHPKRSSRWLSLPVDG
uniref:Uncharacterized protein n=1 Tax=Oryza meridionalis TaxID=40149 RepID=A0A0E0C3A9_9ORYZ